MLIAVCNVTSIMKYAIFSLKLSIMQDDAQRTKIIHNVAFCTPH